MTPKRLFLSPPHLGAQELTFVQQAFESNYIAPLGPMVDDFEKEFAKKVDLPYAVALSSGTAAMHLALRILGVGEGDEVFASTLTFVGGVTPITFEGATPVLIDSDRESWNMDPDLLAEELEACKKRGKLPKAVVPTDLYGQCADYNRILEICERYDVPVVADSSEALGAVYFSLATDTHRPTQTISPADTRRGNTIIASRSQSTQQQTGAAHQSGKSANPEQFKERSAGWGAKAVVYSFNGNKIITTSGGGMLASDDEAFIEKARFLSQQAREPGPHYEHSEIGYNYRMSNVLAAIGRGQLKVLDERVKRKREIFDYYQKALNDLPGIEFMPEAPYGRSNRWLTVVLIAPEEFGADREEVRRALEEENTESRPVWKPMHLQPVFQSTDSADSSDYKKPNIKKNRVKCRVVGGEVAEDLFARGLCLPSGTAMSNSDIDRVVSVISKCAQS
jgi:dTDP-4-amino-4,6-dideoxygalactose transaminase